MRAQTTANGSSGSGEREAGSENSLSQEETDTSHSPLPALRSTDFSLPETTVITNAKMFGIGAANILDTYLSPEKYKGMTLRYISMTDRESRHHAAISYRLVHQGVLDVVRNRADNNSEIGGLYNFQYAIHYNWRLADNRLRVRAGGGVDASVGFLYNTRNQNNPAQARLALNIAPSAGISYDVFVRRKKCRVNYDVMFPLLGVMFSPNYGQSYYEIFNEGDNDHNVVFTTIGSAPSLRHMLSFDFPVGKMCFRVGYMGDYQQYDVNRLKYHNYAHTFVLGIVKRFSIHHLGL